MTLIWHEEEVALSSALLDLTDSAKLTVQTCVGTLARTGSRALNDFTDPVNSSQSWRGANLIRRIHEDMLIATLAATDQIAAAAMILRSSRPLSVSLTTAVRGGLEAISRVDHLLHSADGRDLAFRMSSLAFWDLERVSFTKPTEGLKTAAGGTVGSARYRASIRKWMQSVEMGEPQRVGQTKLVGTLLAEVLGISVAKGRTLYEDLSGVAHGSATAINYFLVADEARTGRPDAVDLLPDPHIIAEHTAYVSAALIHVTDLMVAYFHLEGMEKDRWVDDRNRSNLARALASERLRLHASRTSSSAK